MRGLRTGLAGVFAVYGLYVGGVGLLLNTSLWSRLTGMRDPERTSISFEGADSFFPGRIRARRALIEIRLEDLRTCIDLWALARRREVTLPRVWAGRARVDVRLRTAEETARYLARYGDPTGMMLKGAAARAELVADAFTLRIPDVDLPRIEELRFGAGRVLTGHLAVKGGFELTPSLRASIRPSVLTGIEGRLELRAAEFDVPTTAGNEFFRYVDGTLEGRARVDGLAFGGVRVRAAEAGENLAVLCGLRAGRLQPGSRATLTRARLEAGGGRSFTGGGIGTLEWRADARGRDRSTLRLRVDRPRARGRVVTPRASWQANAATIRVDADLNGLDLASPPRSARWRARVSGGHASIDLPSTRSRPWRLAARSRIGGGLSLAAGAATRAVVEEPSLRFDGLRLEAVRDRGVVPAGGEHRIVAEGSATLGGARFDLDLGEAELARFDLGLTVLGERGFAVETRTRGVRLSLLPGLRSRGATRVVVPSLAEPGELALAEGWIGEETARGMRIAGSLDGEAVWETGPEGVWARFSGVDLSGPISASGTVLARAGRETRGAFEARVLGFPVGVTVQRGDADTALLPGPRWFDQ